MLSNRVRLLMLLVGGQLCTASGSATRDVHLFNSIIGVYQLSYHGVVLHGGEANPKRVCARTHRELHSASPSPKLPWWVWRHRDVSSISLH